MIETRHRIPGRVRLRIRQLAHNGALAWRLEQRLTRVEGVADVACNLGCASLVLRYRESLLGQAELEAIILGVLHAPEDDEADPAGQTIACLGCQRATRKGREHRSWLGRILGFGLLCGYLAYVLIREHVLKRPVTQSPLSLTGLIALAGALPLLRDAWHETFTEKRFTIHQFLAFSLLLAILVGEALTAFEIIFVLHGGQLLEAYVANRSRREIRRMLALSIKDAPRTRRSARRWRRCVRAT
ncbi:HMA2 domain-containing protein [Thiocystis violascens]|uniref:HMA2 domain-containing protein n=1 Tax=Thiocystis violascens TaxID=73141 RepID=UPI00022C5211|nr:hypothetical protein [Thiocystis violascens]